MSTKLDDTDINAQRHIRVSGGAGHQGPDGCGLIAAIAECSTSDGDG